MELTGVKGELNTGVNKVSEKFQREEMNGFMLFRIENKNKYLVDFDLVFIQRLK